MWINVFQRKKNLKVKIVPQNIESTFETVIEKIDDETFNYNFINSTGEHIISFTINTNYADKISIKDSFSSPTFKREIKRYLSIEYSDEIYYLEYPDYNKIKSLMDNKPTIIKKSKFKLKEKIKVLSDLYPLKSKSGRTLSYLRFEDKLYIYNKMIKVVGEVPIEYTDIYKNQILTFDKYLVIKGRENISIINLKNGRIKTINNYKYDIERFYGSFINLDGKNELQFPKYGYIKYKDSNGDYYIGKLNKYLNVVESYPFEDLFDNLYYKPNKYILSYNLKDYSIHIIDNKNKRYKIDYVSIYCMDKDSIFYVQGNDVYYAKIEDIINNKNLEKYEYISPDLYNNERIFIKNINNEIILNDIYKIKEKYKYYANEGIIIDKNSISIINGNKIDMNDEIINIEFVRSFIDGVIYKIITSSSSNTKCVYISNTLE